MLVESSIFQSCGQGQVKTKLLEQQKWVNEKLREIQESDPVLADPEPESEIGTESWKATTHAEMEVERQSLMKLQKFAQEAINLAEKGLIGKCKGCGGDVEEARLKSVVTMAKCAACATSASSPVQYQRAA